jgi:DNA polymerase-4
VITHSEPVTISRETTFERDLHAVQDREQLGAIFTRLCEQVAQDLQRKGYLGRTIGIKLRYDNFKSVTRDQSIEFYTADAATLRRVAGQCLKRVDLQRRLRLLGVRVSSLVPSEGQTRKPWSALGESGADHQVQEELPGLNGDEPQV